MCDILLAIGNATLNGSSIIGKNSDRPTNESQPLAYNPWLRHDEKTIACQNIKIPQVSETSEHIGSRPYWCWGYEHGVNEFSVAIGNLGVYSKEPYEKPSGKTGLIGMDLVRLGLERGGSAHEAMLIITGLLEEHGAGTCESPIQTQYHNNFVIVDPDEAWVLEAAGHYWAAKRIIDSVYSSSNMYSIQSEWDEGHPDLVRHAQEMGWCDSRSDFNFSRAYGEYTRVRYDGAMTRCRRGRQLLKGLEGEITSRTMMGFLRDHLKGSFLEPYWIPGENFVRSICVHDNPWAQAQTAASMVAELKKDAPDILRASCWVSMAPPCVGVFLPLYPKGVRAPARLSFARDRYSPESPWWIFKRLQRRAERNFHLLGPVARKTWSDFETIMLKRRSKIEDEATQRVEEGSDEEAIALLQGFVDSYTADAFKKARHLDSQFSRLEATSSPYKDIRECYLDSLNEEVGIEF